jgi:Asp-tRNA(Asn)/Glu-tRNA(Gln) amidotransferase A subunit family amidase
VLAGRDWSAGSTDGPRPRVAFARTPLWDQVQPDVHATIEHVAASVAGEELELPDWFDELVSAQATIQLSEGAQSLAWEREHHRAQLSDTLAEILDTGAALPPATRADAERTRSELGPDLTSLIRPFDAVLTPSATGVPPLGTHSTGDPLFSRAWNAIGAPSISLPLAWTGAPRLPVGLQLVGAPHCDARLLAAAYRIGL